MSFNNLLVTIFQFNIHNAINNKECNNITNARISSVASVFLRRTQRNKHGLKPVKAGSLPKELAVKLIETITKELINSIYMSSERSYALAYLVSSQISLLLNRALILIYGKEL